MTACRCTSSDELDGSLAQLEVVGLGHVDLGVGGVWLV